MDEVVIDEFLAQACRDGARRPEWRWSSLAMYQDGVLHLPVDDDGRSLQHEFLHHLISLARSNNLTEEQEETAVETVVEFFR